MGRKPKKTDSTSKPPGFDPILRHAMAEMFDVAKKYDIAAQINLVSKTHSEYLYHFPESWTFLRIMDRQIRFHAHSRDFDDRADFEEMMTLSLHCLLQFRDLATQTFVYMTNLIEEIAKTVKFVHKPFKNHTPKLDDDE